MTAADAAEAAETDPQLSVDGDGIVEVRVPVDPERNSELAIDGRAKLVDSRRPAVGRDSLIELRIAHDAAVDATVPLCSQDVTRGPDRGSLLRRRVSPLVDFLGFCVEPVGLVAMDGRLGLDAKR